MVDRALIKGKWMRLDNHFPDKAFKITMLKY